MAQETSSAKEAEGRKNYKGVKASVLWQSKVTLGG
jgi:hypothetical protein